MCTHRPHHRWQNTPNTIRPNGRQVRACDVCYMLILRAVLSNVTALFFGYWYFGVQADDVSEHELAASTGLTVSGPPVHALSPGVLIAVVMFSIW